MKNEIHYNRIFFKKIKIWPVKDNGLNPANVIEDQFDWHNVFTGQYYMGDITYKGLVQFYPQSKI